VEPVDNLARRFPSPDLRRRVEAGEELLGKASTLRFTNAHGTDVICDLGAYPVITEYGYTDTPGRWDHWPAGFLNRDARWEGLVTDKRSVGMESRVFYGNVLFSTGPNQELGGSNDTLCHIDIPMRGCSLHLDDQPIVVDGDIVVDDMKA
jgi:hypothetical protein